MIKPKVWYNKLYLWTWGDFMELYYNLINTYSVDKENEKKAIKEIDECIDQNYLEEDEVIEMCRSNDTVVLIEVEQDDGYSETILVDNTGFMRERVIFSLDTIAEAKVNIINNGIDNYFDGITLVEIQDYIEEFNYTMKEVYNEKLDQFLLIEYENNKDELSNKLGEYYKKNN